MMAGLAHESRNALQRSRACLEMLALEVEDRPEALDLVARIDRAQDYLATLYEEVRQYAAPIKLQHKLCDLGQVWRETWADLAHLHTDKRIQLREQCGDTDSSCSVDRFTIGQVWRNILENAIHFSPEGARVEIRCAETALARRAAVRISFIDEGPGMNAEQRKRVFEPFFTTKTKGTGLGMAIAHRIISTHGGTINAADRDSPGAEIVVVLPRDAE
jgi:two-component system sensor kinase FixL